MKDWQRRSFFDGIRKYKKPLYGLGLLISVISMFNIITNLLSSDIAQIFGHVLDAYERFFRGPINYLLTSVGIRVPYWLADVLLIYVLFGSALARTKLTLRTRLRESIFGGNHRIDMPDRHREPTETWMSFRHLYEPKRLKWVGPAPKNWAVRALGPVKARVGSFYASSPTVLRVLLDIVFFPISFWAFISEALLVYVDNQQNPEESWYYLISRKRYLSVVESFQRGYHWFNVIAQEDFRYFFAGQFLSVVFFTTLALLVNSALAG
ncbi:hypothetical protein [Neorhizobium galegae]|uniref:hypothetical protein n=1 Tax=Neorhizobium galegae TaxID=399 RepID=UPI0021042E0E|nr:hypothetical protein [Neorhizobium galegae]MCQ1839221.1 hypothetical protein [Neorhizobium galegae]